LPKNCSLAEFATRLRTASMPLSGYIAANRFKIDLRTIFPRQDADVVRVLREALAQ
jgi:hypothetical protein